MNTYDLITQNFDELYHHGIKGQKWGIRRYQNPDGSLTAAGKERYGTAENLKKAMDAKAAKSNLRKARMAKQRARYKHKNAQDKYSQAKSQKNKGDVREWNNVISTGVQSIKANKKYKQAKAEYKEIKNSTAKKAKVSYNKIKNNTISTLKKNKKFAAIGTTAVVGTGVASAAVVGVAVAKTVKELRNVGVSALKSYAENPFLRW